MGADQSIPDRVQDSKERRAELGRIEEEAYQTVRRSLAEFNRRAPQPTDPSEPRSIDIATALNNRLGSAFVDSSNPATPSSEVKPTTQVKHAGKPSRKENSPVVSAQQSSVNAPLLQSTATEIDGDTIAVAIPQQQVSKVVPAKRPIAGSVFVEDRRRPYGPSGSVPKTSQNTAQARASSEVQSGAERDDERPPKWYRDLKRDHTRNRGESGPDTLLAALRSYISKAQKLSAESKPVDDTFNEIRTRIHTIAFVKVTGQLLKNKRMLDNVDGLPQLFNFAFSREVDWPWDIRADAEELYNKWAHGIFETDLLRGIIASKPASTIDPKYEGRVSAHYHGNGKLLNGQWWPTRLTMLRDGAHGEIQAGISGAKGEGAYACVMSGGLDMDGHEYPDEDRGEIVLYCGTDSANGEVTAPTRRMIESIGKKPVRLIRSSKVKSTHAPEFGYRYDGLYSVVSMEKMDSGNLLRRRHRFKLVRLTGQGPLRSGNGPESRPTAQEMQAFKKLQAQSRGTDLI